MFWWRSHQNIRHELACRQVERTVIGAIWHTTCHASSNSGDRWCGGQLVPYGTDSAAKVTSPRLIEPWRQVERSAIGAIWHRVGCERNIYEAYRTVETGRAHGNWCHMAHTCIPHSRSCSERKTHFRTLPENIAHKSYGLY